MATHLTCFLSYFQYMRYFVFDTNINYLSAIKKDHFTYKTGPV